MNYVLEQIEKNTYQTDYLMETIETLGQMPQPDGPGNVAGSSRAEALGLVVQCRETTNKQLLKFYEKLYDDLKESILKKNNIVNRFEEITEFMKSLKKDDFTEEVWDTLNESLMSQLERAL